jgi:hypothetical protein
LLEGLAASIHQIAAKTSSRKLSGTKLTGAVKRRGDESAWGDSRHVIGMERHAQPLLRSHEGI